MNVYLLRISHAYRIHHHGSQRIVHTPHISVHIRRKREREIEESSHTNACRTADEQQIEYRVCVSECVNGSRAQEEEEEARR